MERREAKFQTWHRTARKQTHEEKDHEKEGKFKARHNSEARGATKLRGQLKVHRHTLKDITGGKVQLKQGKGGCDKEKKTSRDEKKELGAVQSESRS